MIIHFGKRLKFGLDISLIALGMEMGRLVDFDNIKIRSCLVHLSSPLIEYYVSLMLWKCVCMHMSVYLIENHLKIFCYNLTLFTVTIK